MCGTVTRMPRNRQGAATRAEAHWGLRQAQGGNHRAPIGPMAHRSKRSHKQCGRPDQVPCQPQPQPATSRAEPRGTPRKPQQGQHKLGQSQHVGKGRAHRPQVAKAKQRGHRPAPSLRQQLSLISRPAQQAESTSNAWPHSPDHWQGVGPWRSHQVDRRSPNRWTQPGKPATGATAKPNKPTRAGRRAPLREGTATSTPKATHTN